MAAFLLEYDQTFCSNKECELNVSPASPNVQGRGNWASRRDGRGRPIALRRENVLRFVRSGLESFS